MLAEDYLSKGSPSPHLIEEKERAVPNLFILATVYKPPTSLPCWMLREALLSHGFMSSISCLSVRMAFFTEEAKYQSMKKPDSGWHGGRAFLLWELPDCSGTTQSTTYSVWTYPNPSCHIWSSGYYQKIMATDVYLIRKSANPRSVKYTAVEEVRLSSLRTAYASVTGVLATGVVTITGSTMTDGMQVIFTSLTGGSSLATGVAYFAVNSTGSTCKLATEEGGSAISLGSNITAASAIVVNPQFRVWSSEFRDVFSAGTVAQQVSTSGSTLATIAGAATAITFPTVALGSIAGATALEATVSPSTSDEILHYPLRQTFVNRSFWIFDRGASAAPRYLYAEYQAGDVIADNPPTAV